MCSSLLGQGRSLSKSACEKGSALVEFALVLPLFMLLITGMITFGISLNQYLELTNAVAGGAQYLSTLRANTTDPCSEVSTAIDQAAPFLDPNHLTITYVLNGVTYGPYTSSASSSCSSATTTSGAAGNLVQGQPAQIVASYPCTLAIYGANLVPGCTLRTQVTEIVQ
jgi:Flp pilus assembly protein TadG